VRASDSCAVGWLRAGGVHLRARDLHSLSSISSRECYASGARREVPMCAAAFCWMAALHFDLPLQLSGSSR